MSLVAKCDRCGSSFTPGPHYGGDARGFTAQLRDPSSGGIIASVVFDICSACISGAGAALLMAFSYSEEAKAAGIPPGIALTNPGPGGTL